MDVVKFVKHHVIYHFRVARRINHDNGPNLPAKSSCDSVANLESKTLHLRHTILQQHNPATNGLVETFNKIIVKLL